MLVKERMSRPVITTHPDTPIMEALNLMQQEQIRRLPVVDGRNRLEGGFAPCRPFRRQQPERVGDELHGQQDHGR